MDFENMCKQGNDTVICSFYHFRQATFGFIFCTLICTVLKYLHLIKPHKPSSQFVKAVQM